MVLRPHQDCVPKARWSHWSDQTSPRRQAPRPPCTAGTSSNNKDAVPPSCLFAFFFIFANFGKRTKKHKASSPILPGPGFACMCISSQLQLQLQLLALAPVHYTVGQCSRPGHHMSSSCAVRTFCCIRPTLCALCGTPLRDARASQTVFSSLTLYSRRTSSAPRSSPPPDPTQNTPTRCHSRSFRATCRLLSPSPQECAPGEPWRRPNPQAAPALAASTRSI